MTAYSGYGNSIRLRSVDKLVVYHADNGRVVIHHRPSRTRARNGCPTNWRKCDRCTWRCVECRQVAGPTFYQLHLLFDKHFDEHLAVWVGASGKNLTTINATHGHGGLAMVPIVHLADVAGRVRFLTTMISPSRRQRSPHLQLATSVTFCGRFQVRLPASVSIARTEGN